MIRFVPTLSEWGMRSITEGDREEQKAKIDFAKQISLRARFNISPSFLYVSTVNYQLFLSLDSEDL